MEKQYKKSDYHNYIIFSVEDKYSMEQNMMAHNAIAGVLSGSFYKEMDHTYMQYEIDGCTSFIQYVKKNEIKREYLLSIFQTILITIKEMNQYLIPASRLLLEEECIFVQNDTQQIQFCCIPGYEKDIMKQLKELTEFLLKYVDHKEQDAVLFIYGFYQLLEQQNVSMAMVERYIKHEQEKEETTVFEDKNKKDNRYIYEQNLENKTVNHFENYRENGKQNLNRNIYFNQQEQIENDSNIEKEERIPSIKEEIKKEEKQKKNIWNNHKNKIPNFYKESKNKKHTYHYLIQSIHMFINIIVFFISIRFVWIKEWKNLVIGLLLLLVSIYIVWERQRTYQKKIPKVKEERINKKNRVIINEKENLRGEETVLLSHIKQDKSMMNMPVLKPNNKQKKTIMIYQTPLVIGSLEEAVDIVLKEKGVSRIHTSIEKEGEQFYIRDLNSTNGTMWNGEMLQAQIPKKIQQGDKIKIGTEEYEFFLSL